MDAAEPKKVKLEAPSALEKKKKKNIDAAISRSSNNQISTRHGASNVLGICAHIALPAVARTGRGCRVLSAVALVNCPEHHASISFSLHVVNHIEIDVPM